MCVHIYWCMHAVAHTKARESFPSIHRVTLELNSCHPVLWEALLSPESSCLYQVHFGVGFLFLFMFFRAGSH